MLSFTPHRRPRSAFTLIELLVVVSIITILIALLVPAIGLVKSHSQTSKCQSNMRQVVTAMIGYAGDYDDKLPSPYDGTTSTDANSWDLKLLKYVGSPIVFFCPANADAEPNEVTHNGQLVSGRRSYAVPADSLGISTVPSTAQGLRMRNSIFYVRSNGGWAHRSGSCGHGQLKASSSTILVVDQPDLPGAVNTFGMPAGACIINTDEMIGAHGTDSDNYAFADGHVATMKVADTIGTGTTGLIGTAALGGWTRAGDD
jgi:prepilin-type N-terminal cleavage/methylation domain-containing protein